MDNINNMVSVLLVAAVGYAAGLATKDKILPSQNAGEIEKLNSMLTNARSEISNLTDKVKKLEAELDSKNNELKKHKDSIREDEDKVDDLMDEVSSLKKANATLDAENKKLLLEIKDLQELYTAKKQEVIDLTDKLANG
jgi:hypothetical protein